MPEYSLKFISAAVEPSAGLGDRQVRYIVSTATRDRDDDELDPLGAVLPEPGETLPLLWSRDHQKPIGRIALSATAQAVYGLATFAPKGVSQLADEICALVKQGVVTSCSVRLFGIEREPLPNGRWRFKKWQPVEVSAVSVPANPDANVIERSLRSAGKSTSGPDYADATDAGEHLQELGAHCAALASHARSAATTIAQPLAASLAKVATHIEHARNRVNALSSMNLAPTERHQAEAVRAHIDAVADLHQKSARLGDDLHAHLVEMQRRIESASGEIAPIGQRSAPNAALERRRAIAEPPAPPAPAPAPPAAWFAIDPERQVRAIVSDENDITRGRRVRIAGLNLARYRKGIFLRHDRAVPVAAAVALERQADRLVAVMQFPPKGTDELCDAVFDAVKSRRLACTSISYSATAIGETVDGITDVTGSDLLEISLAERGANPGAIVTAIGGKALAAPSSHTRDEWSPAAVVAKARLADAERFSSQFENMRVPGTPL